MRNLKQNINTTLKPEDRKKSNVEVEKGEIVFTKMDPNSNMFELYSAGGKKHGSGGTPLNLPVGDGETKGSSFIFSDRLKVKDKDALDFFGFETNKKITIADLIRPLVDVVNKSKSILLDKNADKISKGSAEKNLENARFKIDAAKLYQESLKGMKDVPEADSFFEKTALSPEKVFGIDPKQQEEAHKAITMALGGMMQNTNLPRFDFGGDPQIHYYEDPEPAYSPSPFFMAEGGQLPKYPGGTSVRRRKTIVFDSKSGPGTVSQWVNSDAKNKELDEKANAIIEAGIAKGEIKYNENTGNIELLGNFSPTFAERMIITKVFNQAGEKKLATTQFNVTNQKPGRYSKANSKGTLEGTGSFVAGFTPEMYEQKYMYSKALAEGKSEEEALKVADAHRSTKESRAEFTKYLGLNIPDADLADDKWYDKNYDKITSGIEATFPKDQYRKYKGNDGTSGFDHFDAIGFKAKKPIESLPGTSNDKDTSVTTVDHVNPNVGATPFGYRQEDINLLNRGLERKNEIGALLPIQASFNAVIPKVPYYSPERALASNKEDMAQAIAGIKTFSDPNAAAANAMAVYNEGYKKSMNIIDNVSDKNVNQESIYEQSKAQILNQFNQADAASDVLYTDKVNSTMQNVRDALSTAKDAIVGYKNSALTNASDIYNVNQMQEHYKKNPVTGKIDFAPGYDPFAASKSSTTTAYDEFNSIKSKYKNMPDELAVKLVAIQMGKNTDKTVADPDEKI